MNILFFSRLFYPHIGGVEKHVWEISKTLVQKGHKVVIVTEQHEKGLKLHEIVDKIEIYRIPPCRRNWLKKFDLWLWLLQNERLVKQADIVHCHDVFFWYLPFRFLFPFKKVFTTFHGYEGNNLPTRKAILMHKLSEKLSFANICVGEFLKKWYGTKTNVVTYGAVHINKIQNQKFKTQNKFKIRSLKLKVIFIGRLEEETGIVEYLVSLKILKEKGFKLNLVVLGDGSKRKDAEKFCKVNKLDVEFKGFVKNVSAYLKKADCVFTSRYLGVLESFVQRKTVFAVYNNSIKEDYLKLTPFVKWIAVGKSGMDIADNFQYIFNKTERRAKMINGAYRWAKDKTWENLAGVYLQLWNGKI